MTLAGKGQKLYTINPIGIEVWDYYGSKIEDETNYDVQEIYDKEEAMKRVRARRNELLLASDWTQMPDVVMSEEMRQKWQEYRQLLRDYPSTIDIEQWSGVDWPLPPT